MKIFYLPLLLILLSSQIFAQKNLAETYEAENIGYFINPVETPYGIVFTDSRSSKLYLLDNSKVETLVESAGCGRYFSVSTNGKYISYKSINNKGKQAAAYYDLEDKKNIIAKYSDKCSQITINDNENRSDIFISSQLKSNSSNLTPISPNGKFMIYDVNQDYFNLVNLKTKIEIQLPNDKKGVIYPKWSPDSKKIMFQNRKRELLVYDIVEKYLYKIGEGGAGNWDANSENIVYQKTISDVNKFELISSEIYISDYKGTNIRKITNTPNIYEMTPSFGLDGEILYQTYDKRQIVKAKLNDLKSAIETTTILLDNPKDLKPKFYDQSKYLKEKSIKHLTNEVPYIHQKYNAPTGINGSSACAPTTSCMALAYYNRLPKWTVSSTDYTSVTGKTTNDYSGYILDKYRYNEFYLDAYSSSKNAYGGYAYMWVSPYSSPSQNGMRNYQELHDMASNSYVWLGSATFEKTCAEIDNEYPHPICSWITHSGHLTLAVGYVEGQNTVIFNDPWGNKNTEGYPSYDGKDAYYDWPGYNNGFQNLDSDGAHGTVAWTLTARSSQPTYDNLTINNIDYNHGFYLNNSDNGSSQRFFRHVKNDAGSNGNIWWTAGEGGSSSDICYVKWIPSIEETGTYKVEAYIPSSFSDNYSLANATSSAYYKIYYEGGNATVNINQSLSSNQGNWVTLGHYYFKKGQNGYVYLGDAVDAADDNTKVLFDAVRFTYFSSNIIEHSNAIKVYPNPAKDKVIVESENSIIKGIEISDISGKLIKKIINNKEKYILDVSNFKSGIYFIKIENQNGVYTEKIIKNNF